MPSPDWRKQVIYFAVTPLTALDVDLAHGVVRFALTAAALGRPASLSGTRIHVTTWDYDGGYRALASTAQPMRFGGGDGAVDPLVMDSALLRIP